MKKRRTSLTPKLRQNWWIDALLAFGSVIAVLSSLYFLAFPAGGFQGGRNPYYDLVVIFSRQTWDIIHTWSGAAMILAALVHIIIHWGWITGTIKRSWQVFRKKRDGFGPRLTYNILLDATIAVCNHCGELLDMCNLWCLFYVLSRKRTYWQSYPLQQINLGSDTHLERCGDDDHSHSAFCIALEVDHEYHKKNVCKIPKKAWSQVKFNRIGTSIILLSV